MAHRLRPPDSYLSGAQRRVVLVGGPQGFGKTMWVLQALRNMVAEGHHGVYFYEHDEYTVLERLIAFEAGLLYGPEAVGMRRIRAALEATDGQGDVDLADRLADTAGGREALQMVRSYLAAAVLRPLQRCDLRHPGDRRSHRGDHPPDRRAAGRGRRLPAEGAGARRAGRWRRSGSRWSPRAKDLALRLQIPIVAIVAAEREGLVSGKRLRVNMLRGSSALAYEPDVILLMNDKYDVVARHHLVFDVGNAERFRSWAVMTIEKNRSGLDKIDLEFQKHFEQGRFDTKGRVVSEQLVDERVFVE